MNMAIRLAAERPNDRQLQRAPITIEEEDPEIEYGEDDVIFPSLLDALEDEDILNSIGDPEWVDILRRAAYGDMPGGFTVRSSMVTYSQGGQRKMVRLATNPSKAVTELRTIFRTVGGIRTDMDIRESHRELMEMKKQQDEEFRSMSWGKLKPKAREGAIHSFVNTSSRQLGLTSDQKNYMLTLINIGLRNEAIDESDFEFQNGEIVAIRSVIYDGTSFSLAREGKSLPQKDFKPDSVYFNRYNHNQSGGSKKMVNIHNEWEKTNNLIIKSAKYRTTVPSSPQITTNGSPSPRGTSSRRPSKRPMIHHSENSGIVAVMKPQHTSVDPNSILLTPRPLTYWERMERSRRPESVRR